MKIEGSSQPSSRKGERPSPKEAEKPEEVPAEATGADEEEAETEKALKEVSLANEAAAEPQPAGNFLFIWRW